VQQSLLHISRFLLQHILVTTIVQTGSKAAARSLQEHDTPPHCIKDPLVFRKELASPKKVSVNRTESSAVV